MATIERAIIITKIYGDRKTCIFYNKDNWEQGDTITYNDELLTPSGEKFGVDNTFSTVNNAIGGTSTGGGVLSKYTQEYNIYNKHADLRYIKISANTKADFNYKFYLCGKRRIKYVFSWFLT